MITSTYASRVKRGSSALDENWPNWWEKADENTLDMGWYKGCLFVQLTGEVWNYDNQRKFVTYLNRQGYYDYEAEEWADDWFNVFITNGIGLVNTKSLKGGRIPARIRKGYAQLTRLWKEEIRKRKNRE